MSKVMIKEKNTEGLLLTSLIKNNPGIQEAFPIKKIKFALSPLQREELLAKAYENSITHGLMIRTQLEFGLRVNELCNLAINQINNGEIVIQSRIGDKYLKTFKTKTLSSNRRIPIAPNLLKELKTFIGDKKTGYLFESRKKGPFLKTSVIAFINKYAKSIPSIGYNIGSHSLRRTYASYLIQNQLPIGDIAKLLGHSSIRTTMKYLFEIDQVDFDRVRKIVNNMNKKSKKEGKR